MFMIVADKVSTIIKNQRFVMVKLLLLKIIFIISYYFVLFLYILIYFLYIFYIFFIIFIIFIIFQQGTRLKKIVQARLDQVKLVVQQARLLSRFKELVSTKSCEQRIPAVFVSVNCVIIKILTSFTFRTFHRIFYLTN